EAGDFRSCEKPQGTIKFKVRAQHFASRKPAISMAEFKQSLSDAQAEKAKSVPSRNGALGISVEEGKCSKTKGQVKVAAKPGSHTRNKSPQKEVH
ncbi:unnamed protein product, partial [Toxocara canis]|uniref:PCNA-clamp-associated factor n=1 Tax=Toxocara canis TaxID=6265 RepID=A0A183U932_TOXCA